MRRKKLPRPYNNKQMGDACEMLVAAELTLAGIPALMAPNNWPGYDVIAQPPDNWPGYDCDALSSKIGTPQRISVKSRTFKKGADFVIYLETDAFDWLAIVILHHTPAAPRQFFLIPRAIADTKAKKNSEKAKTAKERYWRIDEIEAVFRQFENNFQISTHGRNTNSA